MCTRAGIGTGAASVEVHGVAGVSGVPGVAELGLGATDVAAARGFSGVGALSLSGGSVPTELAYTLLLFVVAALVFCMWWSRA